MFHRISTVLLVLLILSPALFLLIPEIQAQTSVTRVKRIQEFVGLGESRSLDFTHVFLNNGSVVLKAWNLSAMLSIPIQVSTTSRSENSSFVGYNLLLASGESLRIDFDLVSSTRGAKITLKGSFRQAQALRLQFQAGSILYLPQLMRILSYDKSTGRGVGFDWSDVSCSWSYDPGSQVITFYTPGSFLLDPSTITTSSSVLALAYPLQRKSFYASGRHWVFWSDGLNMKYSSSTDGSSWSSATTIGSCFSGEDLSVWFNGTFLHYARAVSNNLYYRRGTPNSDGTITWSASEQTIHTGDIYNYYLRPMITTDSTGDAWIGAMYYYYDTIEGYPYWYPMALHNAGSGGSWTDASGFPYYLSYISDSAWRVSIQAITSQKAYAFYGVGTLYGKLCSSGSWGSEETITTTMSASAYHTSVAQSDTISMSYLQSYALKYTNYTTGQDSHSYIYSTYYSAQSFKPAVSGEVQKISLYMKRGAGSEEKIINLNLYCADSKGRPAGSSVGSTTISSFTSTSYAWRDSVTFYPPKPVLDSSITYTVVCSCPTGTASQYYSWGYDGTSPAYADGNFSISTDSGSSWTEYSDRDGLFNVYQENYVIRFRQRTSSWGTESSVCDGASDSAPILSYSSFNNTLYLFYSGCPNSSSIYYRNYDTSWGSGTAWITGERVAHGTMTGFYQDFSDGKLGLAWINGTANPYQIRYDFLNFITYVKSWHSLAPWNETLVTRTWRILPPWNETLLTRAWRSIPWTEILVSRGWYSIIWGEGLPVFGWHSVVWTVVLNPETGLAFLIVPILFIIEVLCIIGVYFYLHDE